MKFIVKKINYLLQFYMDLHRVPVPARSGGRRVKAKGLFKGAAVSRGKDWNWGDQDGMRF